MGLQRECHTTGLGGRTKVNAIWILNVSTTTSHRKRMYRKGARMGFQKRLGTRLEAVTKAVGGGYCRLQMLLGLAVAVRERAAGLKAGGGSPPVQCIPAHSGLADLRTRHEEVMGRTCDCPVNKPQEDYMSHRGRLCESHPPPLHPVFSGGSALPPPPPLAPPATDNQAPWLHVNLPPSFPTGAPPRPLTPPFQATPQGFEAPQRGLWRPPL